jgi:hypothetical protein
MKPYLLRKPLALVIVVSLAAADVVYRLFVRAPTRKVFGVE